MTLSVVLAVVLLGTILIILEVLVIPGTTIAGIAGSVMAFGGIAAAFYYLGMLVGLLALAVCIAAIAISWWILLKTGGSKWMSLPETLDGKSSTSRIKDFKIGDIGTTISRLNPSGKAEINGKLVEVASMQGFVDEARQVKVVEVLADKVIVTEFDKNLNQ